MIEIPVGNHFYTVDPDQMPSDLGLHCLPMSQKGMLGIKGLNVMSGLLFSTLLSFLLF